MSNRTTTALAFDWGATSGRAILGTLSSSGHLSLRELLRFPNGAVTSDQGLRWNAAALRQSLEAGFDAATGLTGGALDSVGVDTWGVDYALLDSDGELLGSPYHYRNPRTDSVFEPLIQQIGRQRIYGITGIQFMPINTLYQLRAAVLLEPDVVKRAATNEFLDHVKPKFALISDGVDNLFGHPHPSVTGRLAERGVGMLRTDLEGLVTVVSDGEHLAFRTAATTLPAPVR